MQTKNNPTINPISWRLFKLYGPFGGAVLLCYTDQTVSIIFVHLIYFSQGKLTNRNPTL